MNKLFISKHIRNLILLMVVVCQLSCADNIPHTRFYRKGKKNVAFLKQASDYILKENLNNRFSEERFIGLENIKDKHIARKLNRMGVVEIYVQVNKPTFELYPDTAIVFEKISFPFISNHNRECYVVVYKVKVDTATYPNKVYKLFPNKKLLYKVSDKIYYYKDKEAACM